jgi:hypothetical protein
MLDRVVDPRVQRMRAEIERAGESLLRPSELNLLHVSDLSENERWETIAAIAIHEGWSFTFLPDNTVRFAKL